MPHNDPLNAVTCGILRNAIYCFFLKDQLHVTKLPLAIVQARFARSRLSVECKVTSQNQFGLAGHSGTFPKYRDSALAEVEILGDRRENVPEHPNKDKSLFVSVNFWKGF